MELLSSNSFLLMQKTMDNLWARQRTILDNIASVETPGYKRKYVSFEETLNASLRDAAERAEGPRAAVREALERAQPQIRTEQSSTRMDENGVNITTESVELARTGLQLEYVMGAISSDLAILRSAIRGQ